MVRGMPQFNVTRGGVCDSCAMGKYHMIIFFSNNDKFVRKPLDLIHSDVCGPMSTPPFSGYLYFVTFIDDSTRKCWIYFMKHKSEVLNYYF
jgi:hypothetical protein